MFHVGKVLAVLGNDSRDAFSADSSVQATVQMWDENLVTVQVEHPLAEKIKEGDIVLIDYRPQQVGGQAVPKMTVAKILKGKTAEKVMSEYKQHFNKRKPAKETSILDKSYVR